MRDDGTWSIWFEGPPDLSTSIEAYVGLPHRGVDPGPRALAYIQREGGIPKSRLFTKCFLALLGQWPWQRMAPIPPELVLLPPGSPVLDLRLLLLGAADVRRALGRAVAATRAAHRRRPDRDRRAARADAAGRGGRIACAAGRSQVAERWIRERQEADGSWGGIQPPWVWGIIALAALGYGLDDPTLAQGRRGLAGLHGRRRRPAAARGVPVAGLGHRARGARPARLRRARRPSQALRKAGDYLLREEVTVKGDWAIRAPDLAPGGWAFEFENDCYPDIDDAAVVALALRELGIGDDADRARRSSGSSACSRATAAGAPSTSTTTRCGSTRSRSATSAR